MTRTASAALRAHLAGPVISVCTLWTITRRDGTSVYFTDHDRPITYNGNEFTVSVTYNASDIQTEGNLSVPNLDVMGLIDDDRLLSKDINAGVWDYAEVLIELVNYNDLTQGSLILRSGSLGQIQVGRKKFMVELRGIAQEYQQTVVQLYSPLCRARFGDTQCGYSLAAVTGSGTVTAVASRKQFDIDVSGVAFARLTYGVVTFTSGENNGIGMEIKESVGSPPSSLTLQLPMPYDIEVGDLITVRQGCAKTIEACATYGNTQNFRGEPYVPFTDLITKGSAK